MWKITLAYQLKKQKEIHYVVIVVRKIIKNYVHNNAMISVMNYV